jgi:hypothetical protein
VETDRLSTNNVKIKSTHSLYEFNKQSRQWELRQEFAGCDPDSFRRYIFQRVTSLQKIEQYIVATESTSLAMRAIVAHGACAHAECFKWKHKSIRWNRFSHAASFRYWKRLVCDLCHSMYDIMSKQTEGGIFKCLKDGSTAVTSSMPSIPFGGNFLRERSSSSP